MLGIPDKLLFFMGHATFENMVIILQSITISSIYAKIAPPSMETAGFGRLKNVCVCVSMKVLIFTKHRFIYLTFISSLFSGHRHILLYYNKCSWIWNNNVEWHDNGRQRL
jgi:hypothetical protein